MYFEVFLAFFQSVCDSSGSIFLIGHQAIEWEFVTNVMRIYIFAALW
jgi:hypothetical protein